jgi:hypothetical protein
MRQAAWIADADLDSRPAARAAFVKIEARIPLGDNYESFEDTLARVRKGHELALFDD